ncbi:amino acid adenylation domain-containing protein [Nocardia huaxiensis]|uniref:Amino acid adenylation domain-containing protein n=1 Tax=Nocardia huaxiensis TaxID=2755382 RepID=A0A7D6VCJ3_9NOCA|nr:non-ribosomal peptide synthetase [Nocardia huaxiensis]QLY33181.1 amino acid adenylation domain-containing protein [Nocardia huaxiensis]
MGPVERDDSSAGHPGLPLTGPQLGIWNAQRFDPESGRYLVGEVLEISGGPVIEVDLLAEAIRRTVAEAENMRLRFRETADGPRQFVADTPAVLRPTIDLRLAADPFALAHEAVALERQRAAEDCRAMVDRQLYNYTLIRVTDHDVWCVQLYHHLIVDGYSAALLSRRVAAHYSALRRGKPKPKNTFGTIAALVAEERDYRASAQFQQDRQFWREQLTPWPDMDGRGVHVGGAVERTLRAEAVLSTETLARLRECADNYGITWADVLLAAYAAFLNRQLGTSDVVLSMLLMGRVGRAALTTPAMAVNVLPLRLTVRADDRLGELGPRVAEALREIRAHQRYSGDDLARDFHGYNAGELLHGVGINLKVFDFALDFDGARGVLRNVAGGPPEDLGLTVTPLPDGTVLLGFEPDARSNTPEAVQQRINGLVRVIDAFTGGDKPPVGSLELIDRDERNRLLDSRSGDLVGGPSDRAPVDTTAVDLPVGAVESRCGVAEEGTGVARPGPVAAESASLRSGRAPGATELAPDALSRVVAEQPAATILSAGELHWTAAEFACRVDTLAAFLRGHGVGPEAIVGVAVPRSADLVVALFAVWRAGGIFLPLDPEHPVSRLRAVIADAAPKLILASDELAADLESDPTGQPAAADGTPPLVIPACFWPESTQSGEVALGMDPAGVRILPSHGAYLIYTSGSTGRPKGVLVEHGALAQLLASHRSGMYADTAARIGRPLRVAHTTSFAFDAALDPLLWLLDGHRVHVYDSEIRRDPAALVAAFARDRIDVVDGTPTFAATLLECGLRGSAHREIESVVTQSPGATADFAATAPAAIPGVRPSAEGMNAVASVASASESGGWPGIALLALGGEACPPELWQRIQRAGIAAVNLYGPTEATVDALHAEVRGESPHIGSPLPGARIYLLDNALQVVADDRVGELYLAGPQVARGYLGRADATSDRFVADPYGPPGARMYRTGDRARWVAGRGYEYVGRTDNQVKIRGHRVELGEVEAALGGLPEVRAAAADIREIAGRPMLIGYVVPAGAVPNSVELRSRLADLVPDHMVPSRLVLVDALPHTVNGKVDRGALPEPPVESCGRMPSTAVEFAVCEVVAGALGHDAVSVDDDFFGAGGDSITAISVSSRLRERGIVLTPQELLTRRALAELAATAAVVDSSDAGSGSDLVVADGVGPASSPAHTGTTVFAGAANTRVAQSITLPPKVLDRLLARYGAVADVLPLAPLQEGLLFHALRDGDGDVYTMTARFELSGVVDADRLGAAFEAMLARHPNLGAAFSYEDFDQPVQVVPVTPRSSWRVADLRGLAAEEATGAAAELERSAGAESFDVADPPLVRVLFIRMSETSQRLVLIAHHLLADGWSVPIMLRETLALYHGEGEKLPAPGYYGNYLSWLGARDTASAVQRWRSYLDGLSAPTVVGLAGRRSTAAGLRVAVSESTAAALEGLGREHGLTMNTLLQGAWSMVLGEHLGRTDVVFGAVISGRPAELADVEKTVGLFSNTVPVRLRLDTGRTLVEQLGDFQQTTFDMQAHGYLGLATVEGAAGLGRLFDTLVVFENFPKSGLGQPDTHDVRVAGVAVHSRTHFPITVTARPGERFELLLHHDPAAVPENAATSLAERLGTVLAAIAANPDATVASVIERTDRRDTRGRTLADWGRTVDPAAPAITAAGETIDYRDFDARANRLARLLITQGVGPETVVAAAMPRTVDSVIAAHAIIRAGGVYLPVDPEQPAQRIAQILETAAPALVLRTLDGLASGGFSDAPVTDAERRAPLRPGNTAYLLFTSGSTGVPKGVTVTHAAIVNTFDWLQRRQSFGPGDTVLYRTPAIFDASLLELFLPLHVGARIVLTRENGHKDPYYQAELMRDEQVTVVQMTTSMLTVLAEETDLSGCTALRCVITGGEALPPATAHRVRALTSASVNNLYGPTEAAVALTYHETTDLDTGSVPIGKPANGSGVRVLDERLRPVAAGTIGELYLTGEQLARGYLARPDLSCAAFIADPYDHGARMYRTGDLVKWNPDGELEYVGRSDSQIKLRGQRIELGDIEAALLGCAGVAQAVVLLREDTPGDQRLVAYLIARSGITVDTEAVADELRNTLPAYMIPSAYLVLDEIPRTASEKIDRKALPAPAAAAVAPGMRDGAGAEVVREVGDQPSPVIPACSWPESTQSGAVAAGVDPGHKHAGMTRVAALCDAMAAVLAVDDIGAEDDFFAAGGHSLTAVRLVGRLRRAGFAVVLDDVFAAPTPRALATRIAELESSHADSDSGAEGLALLGSRLDHVLTVRASGTGSPLFCVHPVGGTAWQFGPLARLLRADRPIIGLQLPTLSDKGFHAESLDELARHYLATIRGIQPHGPYHLLGYSLGGNIVHAMAALLEAEGESIAYVGLIDSHPLANLTDRATRALSDPAELDRLIPEMPGDAPELADAIRTAATALLGMVTRSGAPDYRGRMALFAADDGTVPARTRAQLDGWLAVDARLVVRRLPYSHFDIVSPTGWTEVAALLDADPAIGA